MILVYQIYVSVSSHTILCITYVNTIENLKKQQLVCTEKDIPPTPLIISKIYWHENGKFTNK